MRALALPRVDLVPALLAFAAIVGLAANDGGYFPSAWGYGALGLSAAAGAALLLLKQIELSRLELLTLAGIVVFNGWIALSAVWSDLPGESHLDAERALVYVAGLAAALLVSSRRSCASLLAGVLAGATAVTTYALVDRAVSGKTVDPFESTLLNEPLGYANALGILAAMGMLLACGLAIRLERRTARIVAAATLVPLVPALWLTDSRGAWVALAAGAVVLVGAQFRRLGLVVALVALAFTVALIGIMAIGTDGPGDRPEYWHVAWQEYQDNGWLGSGARTFQLYWLVYRPIDANALDAHNLYLETLAELGPIGLALLLATLALPLVAAKRAQRHPLVPAAAAAYTAYLVHAGVDWDWEMPAVTLAALLCAAALLVAARDDRARVLPWLPRAAIGGAVVILGALALAGLVSNT